MRPGAAARCRAAARNASTGGGWWRIACAAIDTTRDRCRRARGATRAPSQSAGSVFPGEEALGIASLGDGSSPGGTARRPARPDRCAPQPSPCARGVRAPGRAPSRAMAAGEVDARPVVRARGRWRLRAQGVPASTRARCLRPSAGANATTRSGRTPGPSALPSSPHPDSGRIAMRIPAGGLVRAVSASVLRGLPGRPASCGEPKTPSPGSAALPARRVSPGSPVTDTVAPGARRRVAFPFEWRLPMPHSTIATSGPVVKSSPWSTAPCRRRAGRARRRRRARARTP